MKRRRLCAVLSDGELVFAASIALSCARTFLASTFMPPDSSCSCFAAALPSSALVAVSDSL